MIDKLVMLGNGGVIAAVLGSMRYEQTDDVWVGIGFGVMVMWLVAMLIYHATKKL